MVVERDPLVSFFLADALTSELGAYVGCAATVQRGAKIVETEGFNLATVEVSFRSFSGIKLATLAANKNIPELLFSGDPSARQTEGV